MACGEGEGLRGTGGESIAKDLERPSDSGRLRMFRLGGNPVSFPRGGSPR